MSSRIKQGASAVAALVALAVAGTCAASADASVRTDTSSAVVRPAAAPATSSATPAPSVTTVPLTPAMARSVTPLVVILTGSLASRVRAAATKAVPGCTVVRMTTQGRSHYLARVRTRSGQQVRITFDRRIRLLSITPDPAPGSSPQTSTD